MEVLIVMGLLSLVGGVGMFALVPFYRTYCFRSEVDVLYDTVIELQLEAMTLGSDMHLSFTKEKEKWVAVSTGDEKSLPSQKIELSHVDKLEGKPLTLYASGWIEPRIVVTLQHKDEIRGIDFREPPLIRRHHGN